MRIKEVTHKQAIEIIEKRIPLGLFIVKDEELYVGIDNSNGHAWTEEFKDRKSCITWLENS